MARIIFVAQDPGGYNAVLPVWKAFRRAHEAAALLWLSGASRALADAESVPYEDVSGWTRETVRDALETYAPSAVVTGTSMGDSIEKKVWRSARSYGIPAVAVIDFWTNYTSRFADVGDTLPVAICAIDEHMRDGLVLAGVPVDHIRITGNPFFDTWTTCPVADGAGILFVEQPFSELRGQLSGAAAVLDERDVLADVLRALADARMTDALTIALHPRCQDAQKFDTICTRAQREAQVQRGASPQDVCAARLVIGMNSMALFEAAMRGRPVVSYQPGLRAAEDPLPSNALGLSYPAYTYGTLVEVLKKGEVAHWQASQNETIRARYLSGTATQQVLAVVEQLIRAL